MPKNSKLKVPPLLNLTLSMATLVWMSPVKNKSHKITSTDVAFVSL